MKKLGKHLTLLFAVVSLFANASASRADFFTSSLKAGVENEIQDTSYEEVIKGPGNTGNFLQAGDILTGVVVYNKVGPTFALKNIPSNMEITAVFGVQLTGTPTTGSNGLTFVPLPSFESTYGTGAMAAVFENTSGTPLTNTIAAGDTNPSDYFAAATAGNLLFTGGEPGTSTGENWFGTTNSIALPPPQALVGSYTANLDVITNNTPVTFSFGLPSTTGGNTQFLLSGTQNYNLNFPSASPFPIVDSSQDFFIPSSIAPEPSSCLLLVLGTGPLLLFRRKFKKAVV